MKILTFVAILGILLTARAFSLTDDKKPVPDSGSNASTTVVEAEQVKLLRTQHELDDADKGLMDLQARWNTLQQQFLASPQAKALQSEAESLNSKQGEIKARLEKQKADTVKAAGMDPAKFDVDVNKGVIIPRAAAVNIVPK